MELRDEFIATGVGSALQSRCVVFSRRNVDFHLMAVPDWSLELITANDGETLLL